MRTHDLPSPIRHVAVALLVVSTWGCADKSIITLSAAIETPSVQVTKGTLGSELGGAFDLTLSLGSRASRSTDVSLGSFSIVRASDASGIVDPLQVSASGTSFPVTVDPGKTLTVGFTIGGSALIPASESDALCAGDVVILGAVTDTASNGQATSVRSNPITPTCQ